MQQPEAAVFRHQEVVLQFRMLKPGNAVERDRNREAERQAEPDEQAGLRAQHRAPRAGDGDERRRDGQRHQQPVHGTARHHREQEERDQRQHLRQRAPQRIGDEDLNPDAATDDQHAVSGEQRDQPQIVGQAAANAQQERDIDEDGGNAADRGKQCAGRPVGRCRAGIERVGRRLDTRDSRLSVHCSGRCLKEKTAQGPPRIR